LNLIATNGVPSKPQKDIIRGLLLDHHREVFPLLEIDYFASPKLRKLKDHIDHLEALLSPVRILIPDILSTIFEFCVSTQGKLPSPHPHRAPMVLLQINSSWRQIALSTPKVSIRISSVVGREQR
jgi:hypothetical protein